MKSRAATGRLGEELASRLLESAGYTIIGRNFHSRFGEIDLIAKNERYLVFAEVKARTFGGLGEPAEAVNTQKMQRILKTAGYWMMTHTCELQPRFDVIEVILKPGHAPECRHIEDAFGASFGHEG